ncbi:type II toxin-antitoxin system VapC family toxin [Gloeocapsopsis sp. IPPAS B-1203]|uniref:type II toxin-antitoxin system VapC family toxin n=1 Tax=Gloeocapsopsis sp. IPPAS B-1203 TaxID=2049454 RepID=UPI000C17BD61|nr:type II toxin-antitoxin system VapC family toxin [Gloeocapsopsis sp. IPPAS B-1203]PIG90590.1 PIN domain nuclease [Gloeocapsopsis sp. IPPAS B-1203]
MRQLLDTQSFIWFITGSSRITANNRTQIENNENLLSLVSVWEIAIKSSIGKLNLGLSIDDLVAQQVINNGIELLHITVTHLSVVATLPLHHRDPFDRLLIAQAIAEQMPIVGADQVFDEYGVERLW